MDEKKEEEVVPEEKGAKNDEEPEVVNEDGEVDSENENERKVRFDDCVMS